MKIFNKLFRKKKDTTDAVTITHTDTVENNTRAAYYTNMLLNANLDALTKEEHFLNALEDAPIGKVIVFFNVQTLNFASEQDFIALDEYINLAKVGQVKDAFYRGLHRGPCVIYAFLKNCIPEGFNGSFFFEFPTLALYL